MAILLIGSTGNGKSTLGNFLVNPEKEHIFGEQQTFRTARTNQPETQLVKSAEFKVRYQGGVQTLSVIDTPGIFEDEDKDIEHMVNIIRALHDIGKIRAIILVVKFSSKIDTPYKASVKYYSKLLPGLFETNLITVMTDYACDERSKNLRVLQGIDEEQIKRNIVTQLGDTCGVVVPPKLFTIDCLPVCEEEFVINLQSRNDIILHTFSFETRSTRELKLAKTDVMMSADRIAAASLEGEVRMQGERLVKLQEDVNSVITQIQELSKRVGGISTVLQSKKAEAAALDTHDLVSGATWSVKTKWKMLKTQYQTFEVSSKWPVQGVKYWTNGHCSWRRREYKSQRCVQGAVKSKRSRGLHAEVTLEVHKCDKFAEDLAALRDTISSQEQLLGVVQEQQGRNKGRRHALIMEVAALRDSIEAKNKEITTLSSEYLTLEECIQRFHI
jgi:predicted GTPase